MVQSLLKDFSFDSVSIGIGNMFTEYSRSI